MGCVVHHTVDPTGCLQMGSEDIGQLPPLKSPRQLKAVGLESETRIVERVCSRWIAHVVEIYGVRRTPNR